MINYPSPLSAVYENNCLLRKLTLLIGDFGNLIRIVPYLLLVLWLTTVVHISNFTCVLNISTFKNPSLVFSLNLSSDTDPHEIIKLQSINNLNFSLYHLLPNSYSTGTSVLIISCLKNPSRLFKQSKRYRSIKFTTQKEKTSKYSRMANSTKKIFA